MVRQCRLRAGNLRRGDAHVLGKAEQQRFLGAQIFEDTGEEARFGGSAPNLLRAEARQREKPAEPFRLAGEIGKCLNCRRFRGFPVGRFALVHGHPFAFP